MPRPPSGGWTASVVEAIDSRTAVVAVPNCHWTDGTLVDLLAVREAADAVGAALVVDATQSLGAHPIDVTRCRPDFLVSACYKWLLGPYSVGFLYAAPHRRDGRPLEHNWITRAGSEDFAKLVDYQAGFQPGATRYDVGERSNFALLPMAIAALRQILEWRVEDIAEYTGRLTRLVEERAAERGLAAAPAADRVAHLIGVRLPSGRVAEVAERLAAAKVFVSVRSDSLRVAPHVFNDEADVDRLFAVLP